MSKESKRGLVAGVGARRAAFAVVVVVVLSVFLSACGGGGSSSGTSASGPAESQGGEGGSAGQIAAAEKVIAPYVGHPSPFPVTEKLDERPTGKTIVNVNCGTPICALASELQ